MTDVRTLPTGTGNWRAQRACQTAHTRKQDGAWAVGSDAEWGLLTTANGHVQWYAVCRDCENRSPAVPLAVVAEWVAQGVITPDRIVYSRANPASEYPECGVTGCGAPGAELHHFAPVNTFGWLEAETWPKANLCREHHFAWHRRMDGYSWHRKGVAS